MKFIFKKPKKLYVIEKDKRLIEHLNKKFQDSIVVINEDILQYKFNELNIKNLIVFGNLPYNISSKILTKIISYNKKDFLFKRLIFMFQKEVAERILAKDNTNLYGRLSIFSSWKFNIKKIMDIEPSSFYPKPKVTSTLLIFEPKSNYIEFKNSNNLEHITNIFFNQRRKMIKKPLNIIFKNPKNQSAWKLIKSSIDESFYVGPVKLSKTHSNFFENDPNISANSISSFISKIQKRVKEKHNILLEKELRIID